MIFSNIVVILRHYLPTNSPLSVETNYLTDIMLPLSLAIASTLLHNNVIAISPAIYSLIMFMTAGIIIAWANLGLKKVEVVV